MPSPLRKFGLPGAGPSQVPLCGATVRQRTNCWVCIEARIKEAAAHENPHDEQAAGVGAATVEQILMLETLPAFPGDVCTDFAKQEIIELSQKVRLDKLNVMTVLIFSFLEII